MVYGLCGQARMPPQLNLMFYVPVGDDDTLSRDRCVEEAPTSAITGGISSATRLRFRPRHHSEYLIRVLAVKDCLPGLYLNLRTDRYLLHTTAS